MPLLDEINTISHSLDRVRLSGFDSFYERPELLKPLFLSHPSIKNLLLCDGGNCERFISMLNEPLTPSHNIYSQHGLLLPDLVHFVFSCRPGDVDCLISELKTMLSNRPHIRVSVALPRFGFPRTELAVLKRLVDDVQYGSRFSVVYYNSELDSIVQLTDHHWESVLGVELDTQG